MKKNHGQRNSISNIPENNKERMSNGKVPLNRRKFIGTVASAGLGLTILPRHVLGGVNRVAPSDKINLAYIGVGSQGLREIFDLLKVPDFNVVAVCDPQEKAYSYHDWSPTSLRNKVREVLNDPNWNPPGNNSIPGGRIVGKQVVDGWYSQKNPGYKGCKTYADFRELFDKEKDLDAVKVMTPDHLHGLIAMTAIKRGINVVMHKPLSTKLLEGRKVVEMAKESKVITHLIPWDTNGSMDKVMKYINEGQIGTLKEIHNWTNRPVWPQYDFIPTETPPVPDGFNWDLWIGPEAFRPYHPHYTNMTFRSWYDFGGGCFSDIAYYTLWSVFKALELEHPVLIDPYYTHICEIKNNVVASTVKNDYSYPTGSRVLFKYPAKGSRPAVDLFWYDGGMKPPVPEEFYETDQAFPNEGMMFVGDKGKIISESHMENAQIITKDFKLQGDRQAGNSAGNQKLSGIQIFANSCKSGEQTGASFREAMHICDASTLYSVALRSGKTLKFDSKNGKIINHPELNSMLSRQYRDGWSPESL